MMKVEEMIRQLRQELELIDAAFGPLAALAGERGPGPGRPLKLVANGGLNARALGQRRRRLRERAERRLTA